MPATPFYRLILGSTYSGRECMILDTMTIYWNGGFSTIEHASASRLVWFVDNLDDRGQRFMRELVAWFEGDETDQVDWDSDTDVDEWDVETLLDYDEEDEDDDEDDFEYLLADLDGLFDDIDRAIGGVFSGWLNDVDANDQAGMSSAGEESQS